MNRKYWPLLLIIYFGLLFAMDNISGQNYISVVSGVSGAIIYTAIAIKFYRVKGNGLKTRMIFVFGSIAFRLWFISLYTYFKDVWGIYIVSEEWVRVISLTPAAIAGIYLYLYISKIKFL